MTNSEGGRIEQTAASLDVPTASTPKPSAGPLSEVTGVDNNITSRAWLWGWHDCSNDQKNAILNGLQEAHAVLSTDGVYNIDKHWNDYATVEYLGNPLRLHRDGKKQGVKGIISLIPISTFFEAANTRARQVQSRLQISAKLAVVVRYTSVLYQRLERCLREEGTGLYLGAEWRQEQLSLSIFLRPLL